MKFDLYEDKAGEWRWRLLTDNGNIVADSGEGYKNKLDALMTIEKIRTAAGLAWVESDGKIITAGDVRDVLNESME